MTMLENLVTLVKAEQFPRSSGKSRLSKSMNDMRLEALHDSVGHFVVCSTPLKRMSWVTGGFNEHSQAQHPLTTVLELRK